MKREKHSFKKFYISSIGNAFAGLFTSFFLDFLRLFGWWHCNGCDKLCSPRTKKFNKEAEYRNIMRCSVCKK